MYCVKCKKVTKTSSVQHVVTKNGRNMMHGICDVCGKTKTKFVKKKADRY